MVKDRFDQEGYKIYSKLELLLLKAGKKDQNYDDYDYIFQLYQSDLVKADSNPTSDVSRQL